MNEMNGFGRHIKKIDETPSYKRKRIDLPPENQFKHANTNKLSSKRPNLNIPCRFSYDGKGSNDRCSRLNNNFSFYFDDERFLVPNTHLFILDYAQEYNAMGQSRVYIKSCGKPQSVITIFDIIPHINIKQTKHHSHQQNHRIRTQVGSFG